MTTQSFDLEKVLSLETLSDDDLQRAHEHIMCKMARMHDALEYIELEIQRRNAYPDVARLDINPSSQNELIA